ncbi:hypothetical protein TNCV_909171, partial [Trichonephila clavipes]
VRKESTQWVVPSLALKQDTIAWSLTHTVVDDLLRNSLTYTLQSLEWRYEEVIEGVCSSEPNNGTENIGEE